LTLLRGYQRFCPRASCLFCFRPHIDKTKQEEIMEIIRGKQTSFIDSSESTDRMAGYDSVHIDIGTGDGRFVQHVARTQPNRFVVGMDACRENLREVSRCTPVNTLFVIANALALPTELYGLADYITINFPWGSLLEGLLTPDSALLDGLLSISRPQAEIDIRLNGGALAELGYSLEEGTNRVQDVLAVNGFRAEPALTLTAHDLKAYPTTWAKRLVFGRDPRALHLHAVRSDTVWLPSHAVQARIAQTIIQFPVKRVPA
jgi:16S rRNA (adenine(1408)-N(1))-methyltransferase